MDHTLRKRRTNRTQNALLVVIAILVIVLAVVIVIALMPQDQPDPPVNTDPNPGTQSSQPDPTVTTGPIVIGDLTLTTPEQTEFISLEKEVCFTGTADPRGNLTINGTAVTVAEDGSFAHTVSLSVGSNEIELRYKDEPILYHIEHRYALQYFSPSTETTYGCGATVQISAAIRSGASLTVTLGDETIKMSKANDQLGNNLAEGFVLYTGTYRLPNTNTEDLDLGPITFTVSHEGKAEVYQSGNILCQKSAQVLKSDPSVTPNGGEYMDVGSGFIIEILANSAETFEGAGTGDKSSPTRNYLPKGTVDYGYVEDYRNGAYTIRLRCGRRVYLKKSNYPASGKINVVDGYQGTLPDHNEIGVAAVNQSEDYTILVFDCLWNAPFYFDLEPQEYINPSIQDYRVNALTAEYADITFCYTTEFEGEVAIPADNPLFSHAEVIQNKDDCTLRLYLKKTGKFFGWDAYYNNAGQLCFRFINPARISQTDINTYGVDLTGVRIMIDVGHGGLDGGAQPSGAPLDEAALNLQLAKKLQAELESMGATVIMNRTDDSAINVEERIAFLKEQAPDLCIAIHQNSIDGYPNHSGCEVCYATPFSQLAAKLIYDETQASGIYKKTLMDWHYYYVARETACPVVLLENGYMTNEYDLNNMVDASVQLQKAQAIARGIARYFLEIQ